MPSELKQSPQTSITKLIAVRHGETAWNAQQRLQGSQDIALNARGEQQAALVAKQLQQFSIAAIYSSALQRAKRTAELIAQPHQLQVEADEQLNERGFGIFEGHSLSQMQTKYPQLAQRWLAREPDFAPAGGESLAAFQQRIWPAVCRLLARHPRQSIVLVVHGGVLDILYRQANHLTLQPQRSWQISNCAINHLSWDGQALLIEKWNDLAHLTSYDGAADKKLNY